MPTFAPLAPLAQQVARALDALRQARRDGGATRIYVASENLRRTLDRLPAGRPLAEIDPELDQRLRVSFTCSGSRRTP